MTETNPAFISARRWILFFDVLKIVFVACLIVTVVRLFVAEPFIVSGDSMSPTFSSNDFLVVDEMSYELRAPARGDVIIFHYPLDPSTFFIKRLIGLPGDTVIVNNGSIFVKTANNKTLHLLTEPYVSIGSPKIQTSTTTLSDEEYFVLGDNRNSSFDSRVWGPVPRRYIVGKALVRLYPVMSKSLRPPVYDFPSSPNTTTLSTGR